jgi:hypothetical protein
MLGALWRRFVMTKYDDAFGDIYKQLRADSELTRQLRGERDAFGQVLKDMAAGTEYLGIAKSLGTTDSAALGYRDVVGDIAKATATYRDQEKAMRGLGDEWAKSLRDQQEIARKVATSSDFLEAMAGASRLYESEYLAASGWSVADSLKGLGVITHEAESMAPLLVDKFQEWSKELSANVGETLSRTVSELAGSISAGQHMDALKSAIATAAGISSENVLGGTQWLRALAASPSNPLVYASIAQPILGLGAVDLFLGTGGFSTQVNGIIDRTLVALDDEEEENPLEELKEWFREEIAKHEPNTASHRGLLDVFNTIMFILALLQVGLALEARHDSRVESAWTHERITRIEETSTEISHELAALKPPQAATECLVVRKAHVMPHPGKEGASIGSLHPGQVVELVHRQHEWIFVKYLNHSSGQEVGGWVLEQYLSVTDEEPPAK